MATGTGNLPNPSMAFTPFDILLAEELNDLVENIEALATGSGIGDGAIATADIANSAVTRGKMDLTTLDATSSGNLGAQSGGSTFTTATILSYPFVSGRKYEIVVRSTNPNSTGIWQMDTKVSGSSIPGGSSPRFGGYSGQKDMYFGNIYTATSTATLPITVTVQLVTSGSCNMDNIGVLVRPILN